MGGEEPTTAGLTPDDLEYIARLRKSNRGKKLIAAYILVVLAMRRLPVDVTKQRAETLLRAPTTVLAGALAAYVSRQMRSKPSDKRAIVPALLAALARYTVEAQALLPDDRIAHIGLIAQAELQNATARVSRQVAGTRTITREVHTDRPCERCWSLVGTYEQPWPDDVFYCHPRCCCSWSIKEVA